MTSIQPRTLLTPCELAKEYPAELKLEQVHILLRHGERTPVSVRFQSAGLPAYWPYCTAANALKNAVLQADGPWDTLTWQRRLKTLGQDGMPEWAAGPKGELDSICLLGELTDRGRETTLAMGQRMRRLYVEQLGFLPPTLDAQTLSSLALRSTPIARALESAQQAFVGLYPSTTRAPGLPFPAISVRDMQNETLIPNESACARFRELAKAFAKRTAQLYNDGPELAYINRKIGKWMPADSPVVKVDSKPRLSGIMDSINASLAHGKDTRLPYEFYDKTVRADIDRICTEEWFVGYQESNEYRRLGIGALVGELTYKMVEHAAGIKTAGKEPLKMSLAGCHDTTIAAVLVSLGAFKVEKDNWPGFSSNIAVELFRRKNTAPAGRAESTTSGALWPSREKTWWYHLFSSPKSSHPSHSLHSPLTEWSNPDKSKLSDYYVRVKYNERPIKIPFCRPVGRHLENDESFCTLAAFKQATDSFTPPDWKKECEIDLGKPAFRPNVEPPPGV